MFRRPAIHRLIYLHIGRTGGTTMRWEVLYKSVDRRAIFCLNGSEPPTQCGKVEELLAMPRKEQEKLQVIVGHMPFGLREQLPWPETWHYVTLLREPVARVVSTYYQVRSSVNHRCHAEGMRYSLEEFVRNRCGSVWNGMCGILSSARQREYESDEAMFQAAMRNAEQCSLVGMIDHYDETVRQLCKLCGWKVPRYEVKHGLTPKDRALSEGELEAIRASNVYDRLLYDHFRERFLRDLKDRPRGGLLDGILGKLWPARKAA